MKTALIRNLLAARRVGGFALMLALAISALAQTSADPGWPRVIKKDGKQLTIYQPQVESWDGYTNLHFLCAIGIKGVLKEEKFGVADVEAVTVTDHAARVVAIVPVKRQLRFANVPGPDQAMLGRAVEELHPSGNV